MNCMCNEFQSIKVTISCIVFGVYRVHFIYINVLNHDNSSMRQVFLNLQVKYLRLRGKQHVQGNIAMTKLGLKPRPSMHIPGRYIMFYKPIETNHLQSIQNRREKNLDNKHTPQFFFPFEKAWQLNFSPVELSLQTVVQI